MQVFPVSTAEPAERFTRLTTTLRERMNTTAFVRRDLMGQTGKQVTH